MVKDVLPLATVIPVWLVSQVEKSNDRPIVSLITFKEKEHLYRYELVIDTNWAMEQLKK